MRKAAKLTGLDKILQVLGAEQCAPADFKQGLAAGGAPTSAAPLALPGALPSASVRPSSEPNGAEAALPLEPPPSTEGLDDVWPLHVIDVGDEEQMDTLFELLSGLPQVVLYYLHTFVFPKTMQFRELKLSASGQDLGGSALFPLRLGFSGTPSNLLPEELGACQFAEGVSAVFSELQPPCSAEGSLLAMSLTRL